MEVLYSVVQLSNTPSERYTEADSKLINSFEVNSSFDIANHFIQAVYTVEGTVLESNSNYLNYRVHSDSGIAGSTNASRLIIDPVADVVALDYRVPQIEATYSFYNNLFSPASKVRPNFYIEQISEDGLELLLITTDLSADQVSQKVGEIQSRLAADQNFLDFTLLFGNSLEVVAVAVATLDYKNTKAVVVKLYQELPASIAVRDVLEVVEVVSNPATFLVSSTVVESEVPTRRLAEPNFSLEYDENGSLPTEYLNYNELLSIDTTYNSNLSELLAKTSEKSIEINVDYSQFSNFINYSSAVERLTNFRYKLTLIESYQNSLTQLASTPSATVSKKKFEDLIEGIIRNFDHYERFLYFEKSDYSWPKTGTNKPYTLLATSNATAQTWYNSTLAEAELYDINNYNALINTVPLYLREDTNNDPYLLFVNMIAHHFDNLWIYVKAVSSKYDADNRLNFGASKDLVEEILKNFGVKLYSSTKSTEDLFRYFTLDSYDTQQEIINTNVTVESLQTSQKDYQKEVYKRIYHNLPLLLKSKGTERAVRVLITSFGIPEDLLPVKTYGGVDRSQTPYLAQQTVQSGSYDKIRIPSASIGLDDTLTRYASTLDVQTEYTNDLHKVQVGYSPTDNVDNYILSQIDSLFDIDTYLGDPRGIDYQGLKTVSKDILGSLERYDLKDFVRLIKFFDNRLFKMVKDFLPARTVVDTGIVIKPHLLERSKGSLTTIVSTDDSIITGSIDTAFITGSDGSTFGANSDYITDWTSSIQTPDGIVLRPASPNGIRLVARTDGETPRYTGEFSGSVLGITDGELNRDNPFKRGVREATSYDLTLKSDGVCLLAGSSTTVYITNEGPHNITTAPFFTNTTPYTNYSVQGGATITSPANFVTPVATYPQSTQFTLVADRGGACTDTSLIETAYCLLGISAAKPNDIAVNGTYNITEWFAPGTVHSGDTFQYIITTNDSQTFTLNSAAASAYQFIGTTYTTAADPVVVKQKVPALDNKPPGAECSISVIMSLNFGCTLTLTPAGQSTRKVFDEGSTLAGSTVASYFAGAIAGTTTYEYSTTVIAGSDDPVESNVLGTHPTISDLVIPAADCLFVTASNGEGCSQIVRISVQRYANQATLDARESFAGTVDGLLINSVIAQYYNPSGVPTEVLMNVDNPIVSVMVHPTKEFTTPAAISGRRVWFKYQNSAGFIVSEATDPFPGSYTPATEAIDPTITHAVSACTL